MLNIAKVGRDGLGYYLDPALIDIECGDAAGVYLGALATALELGGRDADGDNLPVLLGGVDPRSGEILDAHHHRVKVLAYDCTFAAPKSVSLLALVDGAEEGAEVVAAHRRSVAEVVGYLEREAAIVRRRGKSGPVVVPSEGLAAAAFVHRTSRGHDPHLHSHVLVANLGADSDGRYSALDGRALYEHATTAGALYRCQLRHELSSSLGVSWRVDGRGFNDLSGLSRHAIAAFSRRREQIADELARRSGAQGAGARSVAAHRTRAEKDRGRTFADLTEEWEGRRASAGIAASQLAAMRQRADTNLSRDPELAVAEAAEAFPGHFSRAQLLAASCAALPGGAAISVLEASVDAHLAQQSIVRERSRGVRHGRQAQIPASRLEPSYLTVATAEIERRNRVLSDNAQRLCSVPTGPLDHGLYRAADLGEVARLAAASVALGAPLRGVAISPGVGAHFEALTAIPTTAVVQQQRSGVRGGLVLFGAEQLAPRLVESMLRRAESQPIVLVDRHAPLGDVERDAPQRLASLECVGAVRLAIADSPRAAVQSYVALAKELEGQGHRVVAVTVEPEFFARDCVPPHLVHEALRRAPDAVAVVLGPARLLGAGLSGIDDAQRVHVVVGGAEHDIGEMGDHARRATLAEIAAPRELVNRIGLVPAEVAARASWRRAAVRFAERAAVEGPIRAPLRERANAVRHEIELGR